MSKATIALLLLAAAISPRSAQAQACPQPASACPDMCDADQYCMGAVGPDQCQACHTCTLPCGPSACYDCSYYNILYFYTSNRGKSPALVHPFTRPKKHDSPIVAFLDTFDVSRESSLAQVSLKKFLAGLASMLNAPRLAVSSNLAAAAKTPHDRAAAAYYEAVLSGAKTPKSCILPVSSVRIRVPHS